MATLDNCERHPVHSQRRRSRRAGPAFRGPWSYRFIESIGQELNVVHKGEAPCLEVDADGMLLRMDQEPELHQILELHLASAQGRPTIVLLGVCWTHEMIVETDDIHYLVRGKFLFHPYANPDSVRKPAQHSHAV